MSDSEKKRVGNSHFAKLMAQNNKDNKKGALSSHLTKYDKKCYNGKVQKEIEKK